MSIAPNCRQPEDLQRFLLGQLTADDADLVQAHLAACPRCLDTVSHLQASDTLLEAFRAQARAPSPAEAEVVEGLIDKLSGVYRTSDTSAGDAISPGGEQRSDTSAYVAVLAPAQSADEIGKLGDYRVLKVLGAGGMGIVFEAEDPQLRRRVALKVMKLALAQDPANRQRFLREAQATAAIEHDHIVAIHEVSEDRGVPFLAMQLLKGETLEDQLRRAEGVSPPVPLPIVHVLRIAREIAAGLAAAHAQGLTHRDIKPTNIWLEKSGRVKILDFGLARPAQDDAHLTQTGSIAGTPQYMAPEQAAGHAVDHLSDLFSLGCVLYRMLTGRLPFRGPSTMAVLRSLALDQPPPPHEINPDIPPALSDLTMRLLAKDPRSRPQTAEAVADELAEFEKVVGTLRVPSNSNGTRSVPATLAHRRIVAIAATLLLLIAGPPAAWYAPAVYRIATNQGLLVVETDDDAVEVMVKQNGELVKLVDRKAGKEVTLKAGVYQLELSAENKKQGLKLETDQFTLKRGGREIARVRREPAAPAAVPPIAAPPIAATPESPTLPFVVISPNNEPVQRFGTLIEALARAGDNAIVEIRGNGPFPGERFGHGAIRPPTALTIRAGIGFAPVIQVGPDSASPQLLTHFGPLTLEGVEIQRLGRSDVRDISGAVIHCNGGQIRIANCRFLVRLGTGSPVIDAYQCPMCDIRNCQFLIGVRNGAVSWGGPSGSRFLLENNLLLGEGMASPYGFVFRRTEKNLKDVSIRLAGNTIVGRPLSFSYALAKPPWEPTSLDITPDAPPFRVEASQNVFAVPGLVRFSISDADAVDGPEAPLKRLITWRETTNLYSDKAQFLDLFVITGIMSKRVSTPLNSLSDWEQFWGQGKTGSFHGQVRFQGGVLATKRGMQFETSTTADFRLATGIAGKGVGEGGGDLGADVDLVGPGPAYERWKQTADYKQWLKDIGQVKAEVAPAAKPFVILAQDGRAEQKFATLAEAVAASASDDAIEIRASGPFVLVPIDLADKALTLRAGAGAWPVLSLTPQAVQADLPLITTRAALTLEGLEFQRDGDGQPEATGLAHIRSLGAPLSLTNCRFVRRSKTNALIAAVIAERSPVLQARNCIFVGDWYSGLSMHTADIQDSRLAVANCLFRTRNCGVHFGFFPDVPTASVQLVDNTLIAAAPVAVTFPLSQIPIQAPGQPKVRIEARGNVCPTGFLYVLFRPSTEEMEGHLDREHRSLLRQSFALDEHGNRLAEGLPILNPTILSLAGKHRPQEPIATRDEWNEFWQLDKPDSTFGPVPFAAQDLTGEIAVPDQLTPQDFRLTANVVPNTSLGADVDLVGPGRAYESWKQTPAYQEWRKAVGQTP